MSETLWTKKSLGFRTVLDLQWSTLTRSVLNSYSTSLFCWSTRKHVCHFNIPFLWATPNFVPHSNLRDATVGPAGDRWAGSENKPRKCCHNKSCTYKFAFFNIALSQSCTVAKKCILPSCTSDGPHNTIFKSLVFVLCMQLHYGQWSSVLFYLPSLIVWWPTSTIYI